MKMIRMFIKLVVFLFFLSLTKIITSGYLLNLYQNSNDIFAENIKRVIIDSRYINNMVALDI